MTSERAALSSISTTLDDLLQRVTATAEQLLADGEEPGANDLFEVERSLRAAANRLRSAVDRLA